MFTSAMRRWPCASRSTSCSPSRSLWRDVEHDAFGDDGDAVAAAVAQALDDGAGQRVDDRLEPDRLRELLRNQRQRRAGRLADAERQVSGLAAHRDHEVPARRRLRVDHEVLDDLDAEVARRLEPEGVDVGRQIQVVVDGLRHVDDADAAGGALFELHRRERRVVAADGDELRHVQPQQRQRPCSPDAPDWRWDWRARCRCAIRRGNGSG